MASNYRNFLTSQRIPGHPVTSYDSIRKTLVHIYQNIAVEPSNFQREVDSYLSRKETYSGHVVVVSKIKDEHITYHLGKAAMEVSIVTDYVPWRLHVQNTKLTYEEALFLLKGTCKGFRQLLHRVKFPFPIHPTMIGVDGNGEVKVWWNELFHKSSFGFTMTANVKLREMVKSLMEAILSRTEMAPANRLEGFIFDCQATFAILQQRIEEISLGINLNQVGRRLVEKNSEHVLSLRQCKFLGNAKQNSMLGGSRLSNISARGNFSSEKVILSPRKPEGLEFDRKVITKRTYRDGTSPNANEKVKIIKQDIENLRSVIAKNHAPNLSQTKIRSSKSVESLVSYRKGLTGDRTIPEVHKIIKESQVVQRPEDITVSRFVEVNTDPTTPIFNHPAETTPYKQMQSSRQSEEEIDNTNSMLVLKLRTSGQEKSINSTSRTISDSRMEKLASGESLRQRFGENERKTSQNIYYTSF